jgi:SecD/SecF fusion protein
MVDADAKPEKPEPTKPEGPILIYEAGPISKSASRTASDWDRLLKAVDIRLNGGAEKLAAVRKLDNRRIEVTLMRKNDTDRQRVERQLTRPGTLEFRLLANNKVDKVLIDRALKEPTKSEVLDPSGKRLAWWVPVKAGEENSFTGHKDIARRTKKQDNHEITEILVVADPYNLTSAYLTQTKLQFDRLGNPAVNFTFNDAGGELLGKLTGEHLPDDSTGLLYKLGIVIDGELFSAPAIQSKIGKEGEITGSFTEVEVSDLAAVLNAGSLPVRLRLVEENPHPH